MSLRPGRVAAVHPEDHSVDLVMLDDGSRLAGVQVLSGDARTNAGRNTLASVETPSSGDAWDLTEATTRDGLAIVGFMGRHPVVLGFLFPQVCEMTFAAQDFYVHRHPSDVYVTIDKDGNTEVSHPSGTFFRIGATPAHEDLTGKDVDGEWKITKNTDSAPYVHLVTANAGDVKASLQIDPSGNIDLDHVGNLTSHTGGNAEVTIDGNATVNVAGTTDVTSGGNAHLTAPQLLVTCPSSTFTGHVTVQGGLAVSGGEGAAITGNLAATGGSFTHNGTNVGSSHRHTEQGDGAEVSTPH
jgi:hypothetical protein